MTSTLANNKMHDYYPIEREFGDLLIDRGAVLAPKGVEPCSICFCQDYSCFLGNVADGTIQSDDEGWSFWPAARISNLQEVLGLRGVSPPDSMHTETYFVFAHCESNDRYFMFRSQRPHSNTCLIYLYVGGRLEPYARTFEDFIHCLRQSHKEKQS